jgi:phenylalanyl-tRNA synthetase alpha chain
VQIDLQHLGEIEELLGSELAEIELLGTSKPAEAQKRVEEFQLKHRTRKGTLAQLTEQLREVPKEDKPRVGKALNELKRSIDARFEALSTISAQKKTGPSLDLTMPPRHLPVLGPGHEHPLMMTYNEMVSIFERMGFSVEGGPEVEDDEHNFEKLNFAADHPARDMADTFFVAPREGWTWKSGEDPLLLRTHTSPVQVRLMQRQAPPIRSIMPGRVYRNEAVSARAQAAFFQIEGLVVDRGVTMADLKGVLLSFAKQFFGSDVSVRFRPSFFPFTEPSAEFDVSCYICSGKGCRVCKHSGWLEIGGSGMVHPNVLRNCGIDPEPFTGYAFGMGVDRTAMMRYGVSDIRMFFENDLRFLSQF